MHFGRFISYIAYYCSLSNPVSNQSIYRCNDQSEINFKLKYGVLENKYYKKITYFLFPIEQTEKD